MRQFRFNAREREFHVAVQLRVNNNNKIRIGAKELRRKNVEIYGEVNEENNFRFSHANYKLSFFFLTSQLFHSPSRGQSLCNRAKLFFFLQRQLILFFFFSFSIHK